MATDNKFLYHPSGILETLLIQIYKNYTLRGFGDNENFVSNFSHFVFLKPASGAPASDGIGFAQGWFS
ncbi:MAG: hypothetical protein U0V48_04320 [Anaerolineales bacterium]